MKKVSIITVVYNASDLVLKTIQSVSSQNYQNIEYIVVDGGSTDGTLDIIKDSISSIDVLISEKDSGIYDAMNKGVRASTGDYINFLNAGDWHQENFLEEIFIKNYKEDIKYYHSNMKLIHDQKIIGIAKPVIGNGYKTHMANPLLHPTLIVRKDMFSELGLFDVRYKIASDHDWTYRLVDKYSGTYTNKSLTNFLIGGVSAGNDALYESKNILKKNGVNAILLNIIFLNNLIKKVIKRFAS